MQDMKKRRIQAIGGSSLTLTLPKKWTLTHELQPKDEIVVSTNGSSLVLTPLSQFVTRPEKVEISLDDFNEYSVRRVAIARFTSGYKILSFVSKSKITAEQAKFVKELISKYFFGFEVSSETAHKIQTQSVVDYKKIKPNYTLRSMILMTVHMLRDSVEVLKTRDKQMIEAILSRDDELDKKLLMMKRQYQQALSGDGYEDMHMVSTYRNIAIDLEHIGDSAVYIANLLNDESKKDYKLSTTFLHASKSLIAVANTLAGRPLDLDRKIADEAFQSLYQIRDVLREIRHNKYYNSELEDWLNRVCVDVIHIFEHIIEYQYAFKPNRPVESRK